MMLWQQLFQNHILERGFDYYYRKLVVDLYVYENRLKATVYGSKKYDVQIYLDDEKVIDMRCNCPYAADGSYCKHMAAVLFSVEMEKESYKDNGTERGLDSEKSATILVKEADEAMVRNFLMNILENDEKLLNRFRNTLFCEISPTDMKRYKYQIDCIFSKYAGRQDFINYYNASPFLSELEEFIYEDIHDMLRNKQYDEAFELTNYIYVKVGHQDMDDSDGGTSILANLCLGNWREILYHCELNLKREMFKWFSSHLDGSVIDYLEEYIEKILFESFKEEEFLMNKLKYTENKVHESKKENDSWSRSYNAGNWALRHLQVLEELEVEQSIIDEYCKNNLEFRCVRNYYIQNCVERKEYNTAIELLKEGRNIDKNLLGIVADYSLQLKDLYKELKMWEAYKEELWLLATKYKTGNVDIYKELKSLYTDKEWIKERETIFSKLSPYVGLDKLYEMERLYDRLLKIVLDSSGLYKLTEYEKSLKKIYPEELLVKYETVLKNMAIHASDRKRYREMVSILRRMQQYPKGKVKAEEIVRDWKYNYRNRPAMMDELKKL